MIAGDNIIDRGLEPFPYRDRAIGRRQHALKQRALPFCDNQPINNDGIIVQFGLIHPTPSHQVMPPDGCLVFAGKNMPLLAVSDFKNDGKVSESVSDRRAL